MGKLLKIILLFTVELIVIIVGMCAADAISDWRYEKKKEKEQFLILLGYKELMNTCGNDLSFERVYEINDNIENITTIYGDNGLIYQEVKMNIPIYVKASYAIESIKNRYCDGNMTMNNYRNSEEFINLGDIVYNSGIECINLKNNILPLVDIDDKDHYLFIKFIISNNTIDFSEVKSFCDILNLYKTNRTMIQEYNRKICNKIDEYYRLMKESGPELTFDKVYEIEKWINTNESIDCIDSFSKLINIEENIHYYAEAARIIERIMKEYKFKNEKIILDYHYLHSEEYEALHQIYRDCHHSSFNHEFTHAIDNLIHLNREWGKLTILRKCPNSFYDIEHYSH